MIENWYSLSTFVRIYNSYVYISFSKWELSLQDDLKFALLFGSFNELEKVYSEFEINWIDQSNCVQQMVIEMKGMNLNW